MSDNRGNSGLMLGFITGSVLGAGVALLLAPNSGVRTRRRLRHAAEELEADARTLAAEAKDGLRAGVRDLKGRWNEARECIAHGVHEVRKDVEEAVEVGREAARS